MGFSSSLSEEQTKNAVENLFEKILPGSVVESNKKKRSTTESVDQELRRSLGREEMDKRKRIKKQKQHKHNRKLQREQEFLQKRARDNLIKQHQETGSLTEEDRAHLRRDIRANARAVQKLGDIGDVEIKEELGGLKQEILAMDRKKETPKKDKKGKSFERKIKRGMISYPGLTPGLAPVGLEDSEEEEE